MRDESGVSWITRLRAEARDRFESLPWPTREREEWRRTELDASDLASFRPDGFSAGYCPDSGEPAAAAAFIRFGSKSCVEVAIARRWEAGGLRLFSLNAAEEGDVALLRDAFASTDDRVAVWHFAELGRGAFLSVPAGMQVDEPIYIEFEEAGGGRFAAPQIAIELGEGAGATVVAWIRERGPSGLLCDARTDVVLGKGARLSLFEGQDFGPDSLFFRYARARLAEGSFLGRVEADFGCRQARTRMDCVLEGRSAEARLDGAFYCGPGQSADVGTIQRHLSTGGKSRASYKGIASGGGRAVFQGLIDVAEGAAGTDAFLSNRNLLIGDAARADSLPTLKIANDDVRCSHGSATGRIGEEELFYLQCRGFPREEAQELILVGFFEEVLQRAPEAFREESLALLRRSVGRASREAG